MKTGWLLYDERDYVVNRKFASHIQNCGAKFKFVLDVVYAENIERALFNPPDFVISRQRNPLFNARIEAIGVPVFNHSRVCNICNDKRQTHYFLKGLPQMRTEFIQAGTAHAPNADEFPLVVKPAFGHGGDRVVLVMNQDGLNSALAAIFPQPALVQDVASEGGRDLRVYVLFGEIVAGVMRTAREGIVSNFKQGGSVTLHTLTFTERYLTEKVIQRFNNANAPLSFVGIDLIYHNSKPVVNEVEDVVGSRMLYKTSQLDIIAMYIEGIADKLSHDNIQKI